MALTLSVRFLTGRAHLHHWQAHHSDGKVDWPPSPWRLLRALVAVAGRGLTTLAHWDDVPPPKRVPLQVVEGMRSLSKRGVPKSAYGKVSFSARRHELLLREPLSVDEGDALKRANPSRGFASALDSLSTIVSLPRQAAMSDTEGDLIPLSRLAALVATLAPAPQVWLPKSNGGHTRQFFPIHSGGFVKNSGSAVFDSFATVPRDQPLLFYWPGVDVKDQERQLGDLRLILQRMTYFGRAESWCHAEAFTLAPDAVDHVRPGVTHWPCVCIEDAGPPAGEEYRDYRLERKLAALPMSSEHGGSLAREARTLLPRTKKANRDRGDGMDFGVILEEEPTATLLLRCLLRESGHDQRDHLDRPIGSRWVHYAVSRDIHTSSQRVSSRPPRRQTRVDVVRYLLDTGSVHRPILPALIDTLLVADRFRSAALALHRVSRSDPDCHPRNLAGRELDGAICQQHDHAFFWPTDEDHDGFIDHVTVYCPRGLEVHEVDALKQLSRVAQRGGRPDLLVTPLFSGESSLYPPWTGADKDAVGQAQVFVSATPYFCPLHLSHGRGRSGQPRPVVPIMMDALKRQHVIEHETDVAAIDEIVFDYAPRELAATVSAVSHGRVSEPVPPRQYFRVVEAPTTFPPLPRHEPLLQGRFAGAFLKAPDAPFTFGVSVGLLVDGGSRFIRAMSFCRRRRHHEVKGHGRMFQIVFRRARASRPFAIGDQCHFGLGLFVPTGMSTG